MILIDHVLIEPAVYQSHFVCHIERCKGICCVEGDFGAPLEAEEEDIIASIVPKITEYLHPDSVAHVDKHGTSTYYKENKTVGTPIHEDGRCAYAVFNQDGSIGCGIEHAWKDGVIDFQKPISCQLYPIRIKHNHENGMELISYEKWDICSPACGHGASLGVKVYQFLGDAIKRKYGVPFYERLESAVAELLSSNQ